MSSWFKLMNDQEERLAELVLQKGIAVRALRWIMDNTKGNAAVQNRISLTLDEINEPMVKPDSYEAPI